MSGLVCIPLALVVFALAFWLVWRRSGRLLDEANALSKEKRRHDQARPVDTDVDESRKG